MQNLEWKQIKDIFHLVLDLPEVERNRFLAKQKVSVRSEVSRLLKSHGNLEDFIAEPIALEIGLDVNSYIGKKIGNYHLISLLGTGGMGRVFLAEKEGFDKKFALKIIKRGMDTEAVLKRFVRERQILSRLEHPNIANILDVGSTDTDLPFFVMEYIEGESITKFCNSHQFDTIDRLKIFRKVCEAVKYAHQNLVIHRDIKPSNILVTADGVPKLLDFGIAKLLISEDYESTTTAMQARMFTPEYASPEQINGLPITTATDVYSLGVVLYELLSGFRPFKSDKKSYQEFANLVLTEEPVRPSSLVGGAGHWSLVRDTNQSRVETQIEKNLKSSFRNPKSLKGDLDNIILKSLRKEAERRYQSVEEFSEDIRRYLAGLPVSATADTTFYRFSKFVGRNKIATFIALLILTVSGTAVWQGIEADRARAKAESHAQQVREVAKSLLNETSQNLKNLPDGLEIRQAIIEKSAAVLDSLAADVNDAEYLSDLGTAYQQLGWTRTYHIRDYERAFNDFQKARALHERVVELEPDNPKYLQNLASTIGIFREFYGIQGNTDAVVESYRAVIKINFKQIALEQNNPYIFASASNNFVDLSDILKGMDRAEESLEASKQSFAMIERAVELQQVKEQTPGVQTELAEYLMGKGSILESADKKDEALSIYQQAAEIADRAYASDKTQNFGFNHSIRVRRMMAEIYRKRGELWKSLELYEFCLNKLLKNKENKYLDQKNLPGGIAIYTMRVGIILDEMGKEQAGRENLEKGLNQYLANLKKYENFAADILHSPEFLIPASDYYVANNQNFKAANLWQNELINRVEKILQRTPNDDGMLNLLVDGFRHKGDVLCGYQAETNSLSETDNKRLREALENYEKSTTQIERITLLDKISFETKKKSEIIERRINLIRGELAAKS